jgi:imidazolonepropionase-like amidohydrolase
VKLAVGTDSMHGLLPFEVQCLVEWGATPCEALMAATKWGAICCCVEDRVGTLEAGKLADLITVEGNPLEAIGDLARTKVVIKGGQRVDGPCCGG